MSALTTGVRERWHRLPLAWRRALLATAALWLLVAVVTIVAAGTIPARAFEPDPPVPGFPRWPLPPTDATNWTLLKNALVRYDATYYLEIARDGYPGLVAGADRVPNAWAFLPLYPAVVAAVGVVTGGRLLVAAVLVSTAATVVALAGLHRIAEVVADGDEDGRSLPARAVVVAALFPTSFFLLAPYAESLHLAAVVWTLLFAVRGRLLPTLVFGAAAAASRPVGIILVVAVLVAWPTASAGDGAAAWARGLLTAPRRVLAALGPVIGLVGVLLVGLVATGDPLAPVSAQQRWQRAWQNPVDTVSDAVSFGLYPLGLTGHGYYTLDLMVWSAAVVGIVVTALWVRRRAPGLPRRLGAALAAHGLVTALLWLAQVFPGRPLMSVPRFAIAVPAVLVGLAMLTRTWARWQVWISASSLLLGLHLLLFSRLYFVF